QISSLVTASSTELRLREVIIRFVGFFGVLWLVLYCVLSSTAFQGDSCSLRETKLPWTSAFTETKILHLWQAPKTKKMTLRTSQSSSQPKPGMQSTTHYGARI